MPYGVSLRASDLLTRAWAAFREDAARLMGITALPYAFMVVALVGLIVAGVVMGFDIDKLDESGPLMGLAIGGGGGFVISAWLMMIAAQAGVFLVVEERLRGESRGLGTMGALLQGLGSLGRMVGAYTTIGVAMMAVCAPAALLAGVAIATESVAAGVAAFVLLMPSVIAIFYASMRMVVVGPAIVAEDLGVVAALKRSMDLTRGRVSDVFVAFLVLGAVLMGFNIVVSIVGIIPLVGAVVQIAASIVMGAVQCVFMFYVYAALRDLHVEE